MKTLSFNEYQNLAREYDFFEQTHELTAPGFIEKVLGLTGEAGEVADKIKKIVRDKAGEVTPEDTAAISKELGDVLWYLSSIARYLDMPLEEVARGNLEKLASRKTRGKLHGEGDER